MTLVAKGRLLVLLFVALLVLTPFFATHIPTVRAGATTFNAIWVGQSDLTASNLAQCADNSIYNIFVDVGYPNPSDNSSLVGIVPSTEVGYYITPSQAASDELLCASYGLHLWAWFGTYPHSAAGQVDISTASNRATLISVLVYIASTWRFYGVADDTEDQNAASTTCGQYNGNYVSYVNSLAIACHAAGMKLLTYTADIWYNFNTMYVSHLSGIDYIDATPPLDTQSDFTTEFKQFMAYASASESVVVQLSSYVDSGNYYLSTFLAWVDAFPPSSYPNLIGYVLYDYQSILEASEWTSWDNWATKNFGSSQAPTTYSLTVANSMGGTTSLRAGSYTYPAGTVVRVQATPSRGYTFSKWLLDGASQGSSLSINVTMNANHTLQPVFTRTRYG